jgi:hypothetical protein
MTVAMVRSRLPRPLDRYSLGPGGLPVSPLCLGMTGHHDTVTAAFEAGINFFFITADLHWPLYESLRKGIARLLDGHPSRRDEIVVAVVSYLNDPLFSALQFHEVLDTVPGLGRIDLMIAGAVSDHAGFYPRVQALERARAHRHVGATAIGATFHQRPFALLADQYQCLDIHYVRYNTTHPGALTDLFPYLRVPRPHIVYNFKSMLSRVTPERVAELNLPSTWWVPEATDYYRFVLSRPEIDGILCSPMTPADVESVSAALQKPPLTPEEQDYMIRLSLLARAPVMV